MRVQLDSNRKIDVNEQLCGRLRELLGTSGVEMLVDTKSLSEKAGPEKKWRRKKE
jgi:DNA polymerase-3 subunit alpha